jgi:hypothetical protein
MHVTSTDFAPDGFVHVPEDAKTCTSVVFAFALNVVQSADARYPLVVAVATGMDNAGVVPPLETIGVVPVTDVT